MEVFLEKYREPLPKPLEELERKALSEDVPIIRSGTRDMLRFLLRERKPKEVLEIGTAVGFSALCMREYLPKSSHITTIEKVEMRLKEARGNLEMLDEDDRITLLEGDAAKVLKQLLTKGKSYDFIFMDAAKGQYINWLPDILRLLRDGGLLMSDNVLQDGTIMESRYAVERRDRTIHERMREYLYTLKHMDEFETSILPVGDGVALSVKKGNVKGKDQ
ncbi:MAG TPA: O-methyltransferase [Lachnospiraceae bacterium]|nr:O-methyltransferase [Lachnospiraceae bacterium]